jgi:hypothetical protein
MYVLARGPFDLQMPVRLLKSKEQFMICSKAPAQVTGLDAGSGMVRIQNVDGGSENLSADAWSSLQLGIADPPTDWTGPVETVDDIDLEHAQPPYPSSPGAKSGSR